MFRGLENDRSLSANLYEIDNLRTALRDSTNLNETLFNAYRENQAEIIMLRRKVQRLEKFIGSGNTSPKSADTVRKLKNMGKSSKRGMVNYG